MCSLYFCKCGSQQFEHADDKIICSRRKNPIDSKGTTGFFDPSDSMALRKNLCKFKNCDKNVKL